MRGRHKGKCLHSKLSVMNKTIVVIVEENPSSNGIVVDFEYMISGKRANSFTFIDTRCSKLYSNFGIHLLRDVK